MSALTCGLLSGADDIVFGRSREVTLKGVAEPQTVVTVEWRTTEPSVPDDIDTASEGGEDARHAGTAT